MGTISSDKERPYSARLIRDCSLWFPKALFQWLLFCYFSGIFPEGGHHPPASWHLKRKKSWKILKTGNLWKLVFEIRNNLIKKPQGEIFFKIFLKKLSLFNVMIKVTCFFIISIQHLIFKKNRTIRGKEVKAPPSRKAGLKPPIYHYAQLLQLQYFSRKNFKCFSKKRGRNWKIFFCSDKEKSIYFYRLNNSTGSNQIRWLHHLYCATLLITFFTFNFHKILFSWKSLMDLI